MHLQRITTFAGLALLTAAGSSRAGTFTADFNNGLLPPGTAVYGQPVNGNEGGGGYIEVTGGVDNTGALKLTKAVNSQGGSFIIEDLDNGAPVNSVTATWKMRVGGGTNPPADGFSFCVASDLPDAPWSETGAGSGLRVEFDIYNNNQPTEENPNPAPEGPKVAVWWGGQRLRQAIVPLDLLRTNDAFVDVLVKLESDGTVDVTYNGQAIFADFNIPNFQPIEWARIGWSARTGGLNANHFIDDISVVTTTGPKQPGILEQPADTPVLAGSSAFLRVLVNDPANTLIQWERAEPGSQTFVAVPGGVDNILYLPAVSAADNGARYRAALTLDGVTINSAEALVTVADLAAPGAPQVNFDFNNGLAPGAFVVGTATVVPDGGVGNSGYLRLTEDLDSQLGSLIIPDPLGGGKALGGFFAAFKLNMTPSGLPADGVGFHVAPGLPVDEALPNVEDARGQGLSVVFDVYNSVNDALPISRDNEAPSIEVYWNGALVGGRKLPAEFMNTNGEFVDVRIRLEEDGTVDVAFAGMLVVHDLDIPGFTLPQGADFGIGGRTGGAFQLQGIDDFTLSVAEFSGNIEVIDQPDNVTIAAGYGAKFSVTTNDPERASYQWRRREPGGDTFVDIPGATEATYRTPALPAADNQVAYRVRVTSTNGTSAESEPAVVTVVNIPVLTTQQAVFTFDDGEATNTGSLPGVIGTAYGTALELITTTGGVNNSGVLHITDAEGSQTGTFVVLDFNNEAAVGAITAAFDVRSGGGTTDVPADGWSFSWGRNIVDGWGAGDLENGLGDDLRVAFDIYDNDDANPHNEAGEAPAIEIYWRGEMLARARVPFDLLNTGDAFEGVLINVTQDGKVSVAHGGVLVHHDVQIPGYAGVAGANFAIAGRTGGANTNQWFDNIRISTELSPVIAFTLQPVAGHTILPGQSVTFLVEVNDPARAEIRWQRQLPGEASFSDIPGAIGPEYTTPALALEESGVKYRAVAQGPANTANSVEAVVNVVELGLPANWDFTITFDDGNIPPNASTVQGYPVDLPPLDERMPAIVLPGGGMDGTAYMQLTSAEQSQTGSFIVEDFDNGAPVDSMVAFFHLNITNGSGNAADGASFSWGPNIPVDAPFGEDGAGDGLTVSFDTYDNGNAEAPAIELKWQRNSLGNVNVPKDFLYRAEGEYVPVLVRVNSDGTADVVFDNTVIFWREPLPGWTGGLSEARFAWGARTGGEFAEHRLDSIYLATGASIPAPAGAIDVALSGDNLVITFQGALQTATQTNGVISGWTDVPGATSPYVVPRASLNGKQFWRAVIPAGQ